MDILVYRTDIERFYHLLQTVSLLLENAHWYGVHIGRFYSCTASKILDYDLPVSELT